LHDRRNAGTCGTRNTFAVVYAAGGCRQNKSKRPPVVDAGNLGYGPDISQSSVFTLKEVSTVWIHEQ